MNKMLMLAKVILVGSFLSYVTPSYAALPGIKTPTADPAHLLALKNAVNQVSLANNATTRAAALKTLLTNTAVVKADITKFYNGLVSNAETAAFDTLVRNNASTLGGVMLLQQLQQKGDASNILKSSNASIDSEINGFIASLTPQFGFLDIFGVSKAHAGIVSTACGFFWFTISFGYATTHAYYSCYRD